MRRLELGRLGAWAHLDSLAGSEAIAYVRRAEALGYTTFWVPETVGREPIALLSLLAGVTERINLGSSIVNIWGRDAQAARMAALTISEASGGRFVLGLGVSHPHLTTKLRGHRFEKPLSHMREYLAAYRAAVYRGPRLDGAPEPPVLVAALRERMTDLAATDADGALPYLVTPDRVAWMRQRLDAAAAADRPRPLLAVTVPVVIGPPGDRAAARAYLKPYLRTPTYQASWELQGFEPSDWEPPGSERLVDAMVVIGGAEAANERIEGMLDAGADHVAVIALGPDGTSEELSTLEALAGA